MDDVQSLIEELRFGAENGADAELLERAADKIQELVADLGDADAMTEYWMKKNEWIRCGKCNRRYKPLDDDERNEIYCEFIGSTMRKDYFCSYGCSDGERRDEQ